METSSPDSTMIQLGNIYPLPTQTQILLRWEFTELLDLTANQGQISKEGRTVSCEHIRHLTTLDKKKNSGTLSLKTAKDFHLIRRKCIMPNGFLMLKNKFILVYFFKEWNIKMPEEPVNFSQICRLIKKKLNNLFLLEMPLSN